MCVCVCLSACVICLSKTVLLLPSLALTYCFPPSLQHYLVRAACTGVALQESACGGDHVAGRHRPEAQPHPDRHGQRDLSKGAGVVASSLFLCRITESCLYVRGPGCQIEHRYKVPFICWSREIINQQTLVFVVLSASLTTRQKHLVFTSTNLS